MFTRLFLSRVTEAQWTPSGSRLLFVTVDGNLYVAQQPDWTPVFIGEVGVAASAAWARP